ncbi:MAG: PAS domain S-box protein, partial [Elusimicrobia bacterium]|nr:PAS domain S-box protein [Elusimicrobiota bacterium]
RHQDGRLTDVLYNASVYRDARGEILGVFAAARDVTAQRQASQYARSLIEASLDPLVTISPEGRITDVNEATIEVTGLAREKLIGTEFSDYFTEPEKARAGYQQVFARGSVTDYPLTIRHQDGRLTDVLYNASVYRDARGKILGVFAAARDVTESKRVIRELAETKNFLDNILHSSTKYSIIGQDLGHRILSWNEGARRNYGYAADEIIGRDSAMLHAPEDIESGAVADLFKTAYEKGMSEGEFMRVRKEGSRFIANVVITRRDDASGRPIGFLLISSDISEKKQAEAALAKKTQELIRSNKELEDFAFVASHDLQEPLRKITSFTQLLLAAAQGRLDAEQEQIAARIVASASRLQTMIGNLLAYSRVGRGDAAREPVALGQVLQRVLDALAVSIRESGALVSSDALPTVSGDAGLMERLLQNLVSNAIKFRGQSPPRVHVSAQARENQWLVSVRDNGIGIEPQYAQKIFTLFQRLHRRSEYPGTGIGLAICKKIVERHGGRIWVESRLGEGATFHFILPR